MGKYTVRGSEELDRKIDLDLKYITQAVSPHYSAGILLGGYGRGEGTPFIQKDGTQAPFNDYDIVVVTNTINPETKIHLQTLEQDLTKQVGLPVDLCPYAKNQLSSREFSLLNYEMKYGHQVLWGDPQILHALPEYDHAKIPKTEGTRLLLNRGKLLLDLKIRLKAPAPLTSEEQIRFTKFIHKAWLALGDAALLHEGKYDLSYTLKKERIKLLNATPQIEHIQTRYQTAVELKEWGNYAALQNFNLHDEFTATVDLFCSFMKWYRSEHTDRECSRAKACALNLKWNKKINFNHPRSLLYQAVTDLLEERPALPAKTFYAQQRRFS